MQVKLNGQQQEVDAATVADLIERLGLSGQAVAVELNRKVIVRGQHDQTRVHEGDEIEVVTLVGGG